MISGASPPSTENIVCPPPRGDDTVRQEAPSGGAGIIGNPHHAGQGHLGFPGPAGEIQKLRPVHDALALGNRRRQETRRQRPQNQALETAFPFDDLDGPAVLGHGTLSQDLPGDDEGGLHLGQQLPDLPEHVNAAVGAGIHAPSVSVTGALHHPHIFHALGQDANGNAEFPGRLRRLVHAPFLPGIAVAEKAGKVHRFDFNPLVQHDFHRKGAVRAPRKQCDRFSMHFRSTRDPSPGHGRISRYVRLPGIHPDFPMTPPKIKTRSPRRRAGFSGSTEPVLRPCFPPAGGLFPGT